MTVTTITTSPPTAPSKTVRHTVDATDAPETVTIPNYSTVQSNGWPEYERVTVSKSDDSANTVTIQDVDTNVLGELENQDDSMTLFWDAAGWRIESNATATDAGIVAANLASHVAETADVHGADGDVMGETTVDAKDVAALAGIEEILDPFGHVVAEFTPGGALAVNKLRFTNAQTGADVEMTADGSDTDVGITFNAKGAGEFDFIGPLKENDALVALASATEVDAPADSVEVVSPTVAEFNALVAVVADLRTAAIAARIAVAP